MISQLSVELTVIVVNLFTAIFVGYLSHHWNNNRKQLIEVAEQIRLLSRGIPSLRDTYDRSSRIFKEIAEEIRDAIRKAEQTEKNLLTFNEVVEKSLMQAEEVFNCIFVKSLEFDVIRKNFEEVFIHHQQTFEKIASLPNADDILKLAAILDVHLAIAQMRLGMDQSPDSTMTQLLLITQQFAELKGQDNVKLAKNASAFHSALLKMRDDKRLRDLVNKALLQTIEVT